MGDRHAAKKVVPAAKASSGERKGGKVGKNVGNSDGMTFYKPFADTESMPYFGSGVGKKDGIGNLKRTPETCLKRRDGVV